MARRSSSKQKRGYHPKPNNHNSGAASVQTQSSAAFLASLVQCRPLPAQQFPTPFVAEYNELIGGGDEASSGSSWRSEYSDDDDSYTEEDDFDVQSRGRSVRERRGTNSNRRRDECSRSSRGRGRSRSQHGRSRGRSRSQHGRSRGRSPPTRRGGSSSKHNYDDDETADRTRKRGNRKSDKKNKNKKDGSSSSSRRGRHGRQSRKKDKFASEESESSSDSEFSLIKEEENEDNYSTGGSDEENEKDDRYSAAEITQKVSKSKSVLSIGKSHSKSSSFVSGLTNHIPKLGLSDSKGQQSSILSVKVPPPSNHLQVRHHQHVIPPGNTKSTSFSPSSSSSDTSFTLNTNIRYGIGPTQHAPIRKVESNEEDSGEDASDSETEFTLNTMHTLTINQRQQQQNVHHRRRHATSKNPSPVQDTYEHYARPDDNGIVEIRIPPGDISVKLENSSNGPVISEISPHSVAPELQVGDIIISLDGVNVDRFPGRAVMELLEARRTQTRTIKFLPGNPAIGFHSKMEARAVKIKEQTKDVYAEVESSEKMHEKKTSNSGKLMENNEKVADALHALEDKNKIKTRSKKNASSGKGKKKRGLLVQTSAVQDDVSLFSSVPDGMYQV